MKLPELQEIISVSKEVLSERLMGVRDELGAVMADIGSREGVCCGNCVNVCSGIGDALP
jgi:hypothetical protein